MFALPVLFQRKRKLLLRLAALLAVGVSGLAVVLPGAGAHDSSRTFVADLAAQRALLYPEPVSGRHFSALYDLRGEGPRLAELAFLNDR